MTTAKRSAVEAMEAREAMTATRPRKILLNNIFPLKGTVKIQASEWIDELGADQLPEMYAKTESMTDKKEERNK
jgi:hypothetical protein